MWRKVHDHGTHRLWGGGMEAAVLPRAGSASERLVGTGQGQASCPPLIQVAIMFQGGGYNSHPVWVGAMEL